jgi:hypothetical protein
MIERRIPRFRATFLREVSAVSYPFVHMHVNRLTAGGATRQAVAGLVLLATFLVCLWIGTYQEFHAVGFGLIAYRYTPDWAVPVAVAVGVGGALLALLVYRQGQRR